MSEQDLIEKSKKDGILKMAKMQGYVVDGCYLNGVLVMTLINNGENPCHGCHLDRALCGSNVFYGEKESLK
ncbi:MAG: hypothetical protein ACXVB1_08995 [Pseudobdellovibrionaceae bacterium]